MIVPAPGGFRPTATTVSKRAMRFDMTEVVAVGVILPLIAFFIMRAIIASKREGDDWPTLTDARPRE
jgi:hypothetical protein